MPSNARAAAALEGEKMLRTTLSWNVGRPVIRTDFIVCAKTVAYSAMVTRIDNLSATLTRNAP